MTGKSRAELKTLAPDVVMDVVRHLAREEFIELERLDSTAPARSRRRRVVDAVFRVMEYTFSLNGCDRFFNALYQNVGRFAFTRIGIVVTIESPHRVRVPAEQPSSL